MEFKPVYSDDELKALWAETPSSRKLSRITGLPESSIRTRMRKIMQAAEVSVLPDVDRQAQLEKLVASIPRETPDGAKLKSAEVALWGTAAKNADTQEIIKQGLDSVRARFTFGPEDDTKPFPVIQPASPTVIKYIEAPRILRQTYTVPVISDAQIGYLRDLDSDELEETHDPLALDVSKQIVHDVQPRKLLFIADWMDWQIFSRWQQHPEYDRVTQPAIETGHRELAEHISAAGPKCVERIMLGSNHGLRPEKFILEHNKAALGIRRAGKPDEWPVFSEPYLLRFDDLGVMFTGQYPGGEYYILPDLVAMHAPPQSKEFGASVIHGHTHKITRTSYVTHRYDGRHTTFTYDVGCLCQTGTTTNKRRLLVTKVPSDRGRTNWVQGIAVVNIVDGKFPTHSVDQIQIDNGQAIYGGKVYRARQLVEAEAA